MIIVEWYGCQLEKYLKLSTYNPSVIGEVEGGNSGWDESTICPMNRQRSKELDFNPSWLRTELILVYQWWGLRRRPWSVLFKNQYLFFVASGLPIGGLTIVISFSERKPWQSEFLQSPWSSVQHFWTAILTIRRMLSGRSTSAYFSGLDHTRSLWFLRTTRGWLYVHCLKLY